MNKKIGLVLEGGGHRGIYTAGLLDVFLENGYTKEEEKMINETKKIIAFKT